MIKTLEEFNEFLREHSMDRLKIRVSPKIQMDIMTKGWDMVKHIENPTPLVRLTAVSVNQFAIYLIEKPTREVIKLVRNYPVKAVYAV